jgi:hypothetical protein
MFAVAIFAALHTDQEVKGSALCFFVDHRKRNISMVEMEGAGE